MHSGFEIEVEMTLHALDKRFRVKEIPIEYKNRPEGSFSKLDTLGDGFKVLHTILRLFKDLKPLRFFSFLGLLSFFASLAFGSIVLWEFVNTRFITHVPLAILSTGLMVLAFLFLGTGLILDSFVKWQKFNFVHRLLDFKDE